MSMFDTPARKIVGKVAGKPRELHGIHSGLQAGAGRVELDIYKFTDKLNRKQWQAKPSCDKLKFIYFTSDELKYTAYDDADVAIYNFIVS